MANKRHPLLDRFGQALIRDVRDATCRFLQRLVSGKIRGRRAEDLYAKYQSLAQKDSEILQEFLVEAVDDCLHAFLQFLDTHEIGVMFPDPSGKPVDVRSLSDGLAGELYSDKGWINKHSAFRGRIEPDAKPTGR